MPKKIQLLVCVAVFLLPTMAVGQDVSKECVQDLEYLQGFLLENDAGGRDIYEQKGREFMDKTLRGALDQAAAVTTLSACENVIRGYLATWRHGHIGIHTLNETLSEASTSTNNNEEKPDIDPLSPTIEFLSSKTALLTIKSFKDRFRQPLEQMLEQNESQLQNHSNWIIDVRRNGGGSDSTYAKLLGWVMQNQWVSVGTTFLTSPVNLEVAETFCAQYLPGNKQCKDIMDPVATKMKSASSGTFVSVADSDIIYESEQTMEFKQPERVAVVISSRCGSSCEEFVLAIRQSFNVKIVGSNTSGSLDYSNLRPHVLPSGKRRLMYATSRSARLPYLPIDATGIAPDVFLPPPENEQEFEREITRIKNWLEGGSLEPEKTNG